MSATGLSKPMAAKQMGMARDRVWAWRSEGARACVGTLMGRRRRSSEG